MCYAMKSFIGGAPRRRGLTACIKLLLFDLLCSSEVRRSVAMAIPDLVLMTAVVSSSRK